MIKLINIYQKIDLEKQRKIQRNGKGENNMTTNSRNQRTDRNNRNSSSFRKLHKIHKIAAWLCLTAMIMSFMPAAPAQATDPIDISDGSTIQKISNGNWSNASGVAINLDTGYIGTLINSTFANNYYDATAGGTIISTANRILGVHVYGESKINNILSAKFDNNITKGSLFATYNSIVDTKNSGQIDNIKYAVFSNNSAQMEVDYNKYTVYKKLSEDLHARNPLYSDNYYLDVGTACSGAIMSITEYDRSDPEMYKTQNNYIANIADSSFINNSAVTNGNETRGGALYIDQTTPLTISAISEDVLFEGNKAELLSAVGWTDGRTYNRYANGGAIFAGGSSTINLNASGKNIIFRNNEVIGTPYTYAHTGRVETLGSAIYTNGTLNLTASQGKIIGFEDNQTIAGAGRVVISGAGSVDFADTAGFEGDAIKVTIDNGGTLNTTGAGIAHAGSFVNNGNLIVSKGGTFGKTVTGSGLFNIKSGNFINQASITQRNVTISSGATLTDQGSIKADTLDIQGTFLLSGTDYAGDLSGSGTVKITNNINYKGNLAANTIDIATGKSINLTGNMNLDRATASGTKNYLGTNDIAAYGIGNRITGQKSQAVGQQNNVSGTSSTAVGYGNKVSGNGSGAFGDPNVISGSNSYGIGNNNTIAQNNTFVMGSQVTSTQANSVILGNASTDKAATTQANNKINNKTYTYATTTAGGVVSVGSTTSQRQIVNVANGAVTATSTDAVNGSQLYQTQQAINDLGKITGVNSSGTASNITTGTYVTAGQNISNAINALDTGIGAKQTGSYITNTNSVNTNLKALDTAIGAKQSGSYINTTNSANQNIKALDTAMGKVTAGNYVNASDSTYTLAKNIQQLDTALGAKQSGNYVTAANNVNTNLKALDTAIGAKQSGSYINTTNNANQNIKALDTAMGKVTAGTYVNASDSTYTLAKNIQQLDTALGAKQSGNYVTAANSVNTNLKALDSAMGKVTAGNYVNASNSTYTLAKNIQQLDTALGAKQSGSYVNASNNINTNIKALDTAIGAKQSGSYINTSNNANQNIKALDTQTKTNTDAIATINASDPMTSGINATKVQKYETYITTDGINANNLAISNVKAEALTSGGTYAATTGQLYTEQEARKAAIQTETADRTAADTQLQTNIDAEATTRAAEVAKATLSSVVLDTDKKTLSISENGTTKTVDLSDLETTQGNENRQSITDIENSSAQTSGIDAAKVQKYETYITTEGINANNLAISNVKAEALTSGGTYAATTGQLYDEQEARKTAIQKETTERTEADTILQTNIETEATTRAAEVTKATLSSVVLGTDKKTLTVSENGISKTVDLSALETTQSKANSKSIADIEASSAQTSGIDAAKVQKYETYITTSGINANSKQITNVASAGTLSAKNTNAVNAADVYKETRVSADGKYIQAANTAQQNLSILDTALQEVQAGKIDTVATYKDPVIDEAALAAAFGATAVGYNSKALAANSTAIGYGNNVSGNNSTAVGYGNIVSGEASGAFGDPNYITGNASYAIGNNNNISTDNTFAIGSNITSTQANSVILGDNSTDRAATKGVGVVSVGSQGAERQIINVADGEISATSTDAVTGKQLYTEQQERKTAIGTVTNDGYYIKKSSQNDVSENLIALDEAIKGIEQGDIDTVSATRIAGDTRARTSADAGALAVGYNTQAMALNATAIGYGSQATAEGATAIGYSNKATGRNSTAVGYGNEVTGDNSGAFGDPNYVSGSNSYAIGNNNNISTDNTFAIGNNITSTEANSIILGETSTDRKATKGTGVLSVGAEGAERQIINVADGEIAEGSTDAVTGGQIYTLQQSLQVEDGNKIKAANTVGQNLTALDQALQDIGTKGTETKEGDKETKVTAEGVKTTDGTNTTNITSSEITANNGVSSSTISAGKIINTDGTYTTEISTGQITIGNGTDTTVLTSNTVTSNTITANERLVVGGNTYITTEGINANNQKITNIANGEISETSTDAVNGSQLYTVQNTLSNDITTLTEKTEAALKANAQEARRDTSKTGANAAALAGLKPLDWNPDDKWNVSVGAGNYRGETAMAVGAFYRPSENSMLNVASSFGTGEVMMSGGASFRIGKGKNIGQRKVIDKAQEQKILDKVRAEAVATKRATVIVADSLKKQNQEITRMANADKIIANNILELKNENSALKNQLAELRDDIKALRFGQNKTAAAKETKQRNKLDAARIAQQQAAAEAEAERKAQQAKLKAQKQAQIAAAKAAQEQAQAKRYAEIANEEARIKAKANISDEDRRYAVAQEFARKEGYAATPKKPVPKQQQMTLDSVEDLELMSVDTPPISKNDIPYAPVISEDIPYDRRKPIPRMVGKNPQQQLQDLMQLKIKMLDVIGQVERGELELDAEAKAYLFERFHAVDERIGMLEAAIEQMKDSMTAARR